MIFQVLDCYFADEPCPITDNMVPTIEDIFRLLEACLKLIRVSEPFLVDRLLVSGLAR